MSAAMKIDTHGELGRFSWTLKQPLGVSVEGDVGKPMDEAEHQPLAGLLYQHGFLEFSNQTLDKAPFRRFGGCVASLLSEDHEANPILAVKPEIGGFGTTELIFHRDLGYAEHPFQAIGLHALDVVPEETSTYVASGTRAYQNLPDELKMSLEGLQVITALGTDPTQRMRETEQNMSPGWPRYVHKLVSTHPITGEPVLEICPMSSVRIESMSNSESEELLQELFSYVEAPDDTYEHSWHNGDLLIWDNFAMLHARKNLDGIVNRTLQRMTLGTHSFHMAYPNFNMRQHTDTYQQKNYMGDKGGKF